MRSNESKEQHLEEVKDKKERNRRLKKAAAFIQKYPGKKELFARYYGQKAMVLTDGGILDFDPEGYCDIVGAEKFTYDEYLDIQIKSFHKERSCFKRCYYNIPLKFKGCIERRTKTNILFKCIMVSGMYPDGMCFDGKEDHVWMETSGFEEFMVGDNLSFCAEVYRYVKTGNGKQIDYGLRNPSEIKKIEGYQLPGDDELRMQMIENIICETCYLSEHCNGGFCLLPEDIKKEEEQMMKACVGDDVLWRGE